MARHLITGGAGFIGSHLCDHLIAQGEEVVVIDNLSTGCYSNIEHLTGNPKFSCYVDDIRNEALTEDLVRGCDSVYHLAATVGVRLVIERPTEALTNNIVSTEILLKNASRYRRPILVASTSEVYGKSQKATFEEDDDRLMGSTDKSRWGYAASKAIDEFLALAYYQETRLPVVCVRLFNVVGPRQTGQYGMVIPNFVRQAIAGEPVTVFGDGTQSRCFAHVGDIVPSLQKLMDAPEKTFGKVFNLGSQEEINIQQLAHRVVERVGSNSEIRLVPYEEAYPAGFEDMPRRVPDLKRIRAAIGYEPQFSMDDILRDVIEMLQGEQSLV
ncbi:MAG: GDP-mannose 4,6-dehydratase [Planctomycetota bacterium]